MLIEQQAKPLKRIAIILPFILILALSYWRYTYIVNPNFSGEPFLIQIKSDGASFEAYSLVKIKSVITYWLLFFAANLLLFKIAFAERHISKIAVFLFLLVSAISAVVFVLYYIFNSMAFYTLGSMLKNFALSPVFSAITYLVLKYLPWFEKKK